MAAGTAALVLCGASGALLGHAQRAQQAQQEGPVTFSQAALLGLRQLDHLLCQPDLADALLAYHADLATQIMAGLDATLSVCVEAEAAQVSQFAAARRKYVHLWLAFGVRS